MDAVALAQQAEAQNAGRLLELAVNNSLIREEDIPMLTDEHMAEIGILETPEQVGDYVYFVLHETREQRAARMEQQRNALQQAMQAGRDAVQARADNAQNIANGANGGKRRRRRTRKARKYF